MGQIRRCDVRFMLGQTDSITTDTFSRIKWLLSAMSVALTSGFVFLLEVYASR